MIILSFRGLMCRHAQRIKVQGNKGIFDVESMQSRTNLMASVTFLSYSL